MGRYPVPSLVFAFALALAACAPQRIQGPQPPAGAYGTLIITVQDEQHAPIANAMVEVMNRDGEEIIAMSRADGTVKGEAEVTKGPFFLRARADGYWGTEIPDVALSEGQTQEIAIILKKL